MSDGAALAGPEPLIDAHAHFLYDRTPRADWRAVNDARFRAGDRIGVTYHVASVLGSWGLSSPTYFPSPRDVTDGKLDIVDAMIVGGRVKRRKRREVSPRAPRP